MDALGADVLRADRRVGCRHLHYVVVGAGHLLHLCFDLRIVKWEFMRPAAAVRELKELVNL
jgi:hypothetical protein